MRDHRLVVLRPVRAADHDFLYSIAASPESGITWKFRGVTPSHENFDRQIWDGVITQFLVCRRRDSAVLGLVGLYNANLHGGVASCFAASSPDHLGSGLVAIGAALLIDHAFSLWQLRKIYFEVPEYNLPRVKSLSRFTIEEGRMIAHELLWGRYWDQFIFALYRDSWSDVADRLLGSTP